MRNIRAAHGTTLQCKGWQQEAALRMLMNNLDPEVAEDPDNHLFIWTLAWNTHALTSDPLGVFDANIYYPQRLTLAYSENLLGSTPFAAPVIWLTGNPVLELVTLVLIRLSRFHQLTPARHRPEAIVEEVTRAHGRIVEAIVGGDRDLARHRMRRHLGALAPYFG
mgnify:CR=1 FL=1